MQIRPDRLGSDDQLLEMVLCPTFSLQTVADTNDMTLTQLAAWAAKDHIKEALRATRDIHRARAAVIATEAMTTALATLDAMVKAHENEERNQIPAQNPEAQKVRARTRETIRKACHQLMGAARSVAPGIRTERRASSRSDQHAPIPEQPGIPPLSPENSTPSTTASVDPPAARPAPPMISLPVITLHTTKPTPAARLAAAAGAPSMANAP